MKNLSALLLILLLAGTSHAATKGRILSNGRVLLQKDGRTVSSFTRQGPIDENALIACDGTCLVKMRGVSLVATDKTMFAVREKDGAINLYLEAGRVDFTLADPARRFAFYNKNGYFVSSEGFLASASTDSSVKGFIRETGRGTEVGMEEGTMIVRTDEGAQKIGPGQAVILAMAEVPPPKEKDDDDGRLAAAPCPFFSWECKTAAQKIGIGLSGVAAMGVGVYYWEKSNDDDDTVTVFRPIDTPVTPGSPNR
ncbi:MAG: hypothetical protein Kow0089_17150 [Desulfobulbaceae bacterium]